MKAKIQTYFQASKKKILLKINKPSTAFSGKEPFRSTVGSMMKVGGSKYGLSNISLAAARSPVLTRGREWPGSHVRVEPVSRVRESREERPWE